MQPSISTPYLVLLICLAVVVLILSIALGYGLVRTCRQQKADRDVEALSDRSDLMSAAWSDPALQRSVRPQMNYASRGPLPSLSVPPLAMRFSERQDGSETPMDEHPAQLTPGRNYEWDQAVMAQRADIANARTRAQRQEWEAARAQARGDLHPSRMPGMAM